MQYEFVFRNYETLQDLQPAKENAFQKLEWLVVELCIFEWWLCKICAKE
jgi:hypothetical protein